MKSEDLYEEGYYEYYEISGSEGSEEHIYCEIQDLEVIIFYMWTIYGSVPNVCIKEVSHGIDV